MPHLRWRKRRGRRRPVLALAAAAAAAVAATALPAAAATIEATADASRDSSYAWTIEKTADTTQVTLGPGQSVTVTYTVTATPTLTTAGWSASGEILVANDEQSAQSLEAVAASVAGVGPADVTCPESVDLPHSLAAGDEVTCTWGIVLPDAATRVATTTATVDGTDHTATATIDFATASDNAVDACTDVYDLNIDFLDTVCADAGPTTFTFPVTFGPFEECVDREVENVAWVETADTMTVVEDSWTFTVLCPRPEPNERTHHWQIAKTSSQPTLTLQPGQSATVTYTVTVASTGFTDSDPDAEETVEIDECVDATDTLVGPLGTVCVGESPKAFTYTLTVGPYATCGPRTIGNTAAFAGTDTGATGQASHQLDVDVQCAGGCTRTIGYWKNHAGFGPQADVVTPLLPVKLGTPGGPKSVVVTTAAKAVQLLSINGSNNVFAASNGINKLYAQLLAAKLNGKNGAETSSVAATMAAADAFLAANDSTSWNGLAKAQKNAVLAWMDELDRYNNGFGGVGHCD